MDVVELYHQAWHAVVAEAARSSGAGSSVDRSVFLKPSIEKDEGYFPIHRRPACFVKYNKN